MTLLKTSLLLVPASLVSNTAGSAFDDAGRNEHGGFGGCADCDVVMATW